MPPGFSAQRGALAASTRWRLPFGRQAWRGLSGNWQGAGAGSSIDFQDHRVYVPGDDPRHIHWQAFARTGALTMKLYRAEVSPMVDVAIDVSNSMLFTPEKAARTEELLAFAVESAAGVGAPVRVYAANGRTIRVVATETVRAGNWRERLNASAAASAGFVGGVPSPRGERAAPPVAAPRGESTPPTSAESNSKSVAVATPGPLPWRPGAMKVLISDLLFPGDPAALLGPMAATSGLGILLVPTVADEAELGWRGNVELTDCESGVMRKQRIDEDLAKSYREAYVRHFSLWREACRKRGVLLARIPAETPLALALGGEAFSAGAVEAIA
ncbi:MAG: DUF58 domain-containing protein [Opitutaceae bacterium]